MQVQVVASKLNADQEKILIEAAKAILADRWPPVSLPPIAKANLTPRGFRYVDITFPNVPFRIRLLQSNPLKVYPTWDSRLQQTVGANNKVMVYSLAPGQTMGVPMGQVRTNSNKTQWYVYWF